MIPECVLHEARIELDTLGSGRTMEVYTTITPIDYIKIWENGIFTIRYQVLFFDHADRYAIGKVNCKTREDAMNTVRGFDYEMYDVARAIFGDDREAAFEVARGKT